MQRANLAASYLALAVVSSSIFPIPLVVAAPISPNESSSDRSVSDSEFVTGKLSNGLRYVIEDVPGVPVGISLVVGAGGHDEAPDQSNAAHVIEHILVASLDEDHRTYTRLKKSGEIRTLGATTAQKQTRYAVEVLPSYNGGVEPLLEIISEWLCMPITDSEVIRERSSVAEEGRGAEESGVVSFLEAQARAFGGRNFSLFQRGRAHIMNLSPSAVRAFYSKWYRTDHAVLVVSGDVDIREWEAALAKKLGKIPLSRSRAQVSQTPIAAERYLDARLGRQNQIFTVNRENDPRLTIRIMSKDGFPKAKDFAAEVRQSLFFDLTEILIYYMGKVRRFPPNFAIVQGGEASDVRVKSIFASANIDATEDVNDADGARAITREMVRQLQQIKQYGATSAEFESAKRYLRNNIASQPRGTEARLQRYVNLVHQDPVGPYPDSDARIRMLEDISLAEMNSYLERAINFDRDFDVALIGPTHRTADKGLEAAIRDGIRAGRSQPMAAPIPGLFLRRIADPALVTPELPIERIDGDTAAVRFPKGQTIILRRILPSDTPGNDVITIGARTVNTDVLKTPDGKFYALAAGFVARPMSINTDVLADFYEREGIGSKMEIRSDRSIISVSGPSGSLDSLLQATRVALMAGKGPVEISTRWPSGVLGGANAVDRVGGTKVDQETVEKSLSAAIRRFKPDVFVISGNFDPVQAASTAAGYLSDLVSSEMTQTGHIPNDRAILSVPRVRMVKVAGGGDRGSPNSRQYSLAYDDNPTTRAALAIIVQLLNEDFFSELRSAGGYDASVRSKIWPNAQADGKFIMDVTFTYSIDEKRFDEFERLTDSVIATVASGKFNREKFVLAKRIAIGKAAARHDNARDFNEIATERWLDNSNVRSAISSEADELNAVSYEQARQAALVLFADGATEIEGAHLSASDN